MRSGWIIILANNVFCVLSTLVFPVQLLSIVVVEQMDHTASLYARSTQGHHVCLLIKLQVSFPTCVHSLWERLECLGVQ